MEKKAKCHYYYPTTCKSSYIHESLEVLATRFFGHFASISSSSSPITQESPSLFSLPDEVEQTAVTAVKIRPVIYLNGEVAYKGLVSPG